MSSKRKILLGIISLIITILKLFVVPVRITGGVAGVDQIGYQFIFLLFSYCNDTVDILCYEILYDRYIIEAIFVFIISLLLSALVNYIYNKLSKNKS